MLTIFSCDFFKDPRIGLDFDKTAFDTNRDLWSEHEDGHYKYVQQYSSSTFGHMPEVEAIVLDNSLQTFSILTESDYYDEDTLILFDTISDLFDYIDMVAGECKNNINSSNNPTLGATIEIIYDDAFNYPTQISCSGYYKEDFVGGLASTILISEFEMID